MLAPRRPRLLFVLIVIVFRSKQHALPTRADLFDSCDDRRPLPLEYSRMRVRQRRVCFYILSFRDWIHKPGTTPVCLSVWMSQPFLSTLSGRFWWNLNQKVLSNFWKGNSLDFENFALMTSWWPFCIFTMRHSHGRNFTSIFCKIADKVESCLPFFCYWKSARSVRKFCQYGGLRFKKNPKGPPKTTFLK